MDGENYGITRRLAGRKSYAIASRGRAMRTVTGRAEGKRSNLWAVILLSLSCMALDPAPGWAAGRVQHARVLQIHIRRSIGDVAFIAFSVAPINAPSCATGGVWHFSLPLSTEAGKKIYAALLTAQATGLPVTADGTGACSEYSGIESMDSIVLEN